MCVQGLISVLQSKSPSAPAILFLALETLKENVEFVFPKAPPKQAQLSAGDPVPMHTLSATAPGGSKSRNWNASQCASKKYIILGSEKSMVMPSR